MSEVRIVADFSKPVKIAKLIPIERVVVRENTEFWPLQPLFQWTVAALHFANDTSEGELWPLEPKEISEDRKTGLWRFPTTPRMIGYRIVLVDDRGFKNAVPIRRNIRMLEDLSPAVTFLPESTRHPDASDFEGQGDPQVYEWGDKLPLTEGGRIMVIYRARSEQGIYSRPPIKEDAKKNPPPPDPKQPCIRYRVIPRGVPLDAYPEEIQKIQHPRDDPQYKVYFRLPLSTVGADPMVVGNYIPELGLFERSWEGLTGLKRPDRMKVNVEYYAFPSPVPGEIPPEMEGGGRYMFEVDKLVKLLPDGTQTKLELGDTVELFVEVFDKNPTPGRLPGYTKEARRKIVVNDEDARYAIKMRDEQNKRLQDKIRDLAADQENVFKKPEEPMPKKK